MGIRLLLEDRVLVQPQQEEKTLGGIVIPSAAQQKSDTGVVKSVGAGRRDEKGQLVPMTVKVGDKVMYGKYSGTEVKVEGETMMIVSEKDIIGILD